MVMSCLVQFEQYNRFSMSLAKGKVFLSRSLLIEEYVEGLAAIGVPTGGALVM
jgi:hypothetical protein